MARSESPQRRTPVNPIPALRVIYRPGASLPDLNAYKGEIIEVRIASRYLTSRNSQVDTRQIWGSDIYTDDSDVLAILVHTGEYIVHAWVPKDYSGVSVLLRVLPSQSRYSSTDRHQLRSRLWASDYERCSLELVSSSLVKDTSLFNSRAPNVVALKASEASGDANSNGNPRSSGRSFVADVTIMFNSANEPCFKYCAGLIGDRGMKPKDWTSSRLRDEVMFFETPSHTRYQLSLDQLADQSGSYDTYTWAQLVPTAAYKGLQETVLPLPDSEVKIIASGIDWEDIQWGSTSMRVKSVDYPISTVQFKKISVQVE